MMSALSDVFERSSQERASNERSSFGNRASSEYRRSLDQASSSSDHGYELREVRIVDPPKEIEGALAKAGSTGSTGAAEARRELFKEYRDRIDHRRPRGPAASSSNANEASGAKSTSPFAAVPLPPIPRDSRELQRSGHLTSGGSMLSAESIPTDQDPGAYAVHKVLEQAGRPSLQMQTKSLDLRGSSIPPRVRISLENAAGGGAVQSASATLVRRRRRLPWKLLLAFGIVSCICLIVALTTLSIGVYNFTKLRAQRAARTVDQLRGEIEPQIAEILSIVRGFTRR